MILFHLDTSVILLIPLLSLIPVSFLEGGLWKGSLKHFMVGLSRSLSSTLVHWHTRQDPHCLVLHDGSPHRHSTCWLPTLKNNFSLNALSSPPSTISFLYSSITWKMVFIRCLQSLPSPLPPPDSLWLSSLSLYQIHCQAVQSSGQCAVFIFLSCSGVFDSIDHSLLSEKTF